MRILPFTVKPMLPDRLKPLEKLAQNVWFSWNPEALSLFQQMSRDLWDSTGHNPVKMLGLLSQERVEELLADEGFLDLMDRVYRQFDRYMSNTAGYSYHLEKPADFKVAYFSAEYGLTECLPLYSGGLGILSGDHLKSASDIRVPLIAVGLLYKEGYFRQYLSPDGWQQERYPDNDFHTMPIEQCRDEKGQPIGVHVTLENRNVLVNIWKIQVGRVPLYLLDTNCPENSQEDREITGKLYGGDRQMRIRQEIVLGIGGVRALGRLGLRPAVFHMNEGHSAFAVFERIRKLMKDRNLTFEAATEFVTASSVFTTHTPVPAGNDTFSNELMQKYFSGFADEIGIPFTHLLGLGRSNSSNREEPFCMTILALRFAAWCNGVSELHSHVSRAMWTSVWPELSVDDIPISGLTNGVHIPSWISMEMAGLYNRYLGPRWSEDPDNEKVWERALHIPDTELWRTHERRRERLVAFARNRLVAQLQRTGAPRTEIDLARGILNPRALTIGFARRFATYKRGVLLFRDLERVNKILNSTDFPVQVIFAGKAHPADNQGKEFIKRIIQLERMPEFRQRIVFIEDYDIHVARYLVQGVDIWLNNPRRPLEACGTSGMKAAANGALNLSVLDGWWCEAYQPTNGWAIGSGDEYEDETYQDEVDSNSVYSLLEKEIVPLFYTRGADGLPRGWLEKMKSCLKTICPVFNTHRMVEDYMDRFYYNAAQIALRLKAHEYAQAKELAAWKGKLLAAWNDIRVADLSTIGDSEVAVKGKLGLRTVLELGSVKPDEISVEAYYGRLDAEGKIIGNTVAPLAATGHHGKGTIFEGELPCVDTGRFGAAIRVLPRHGLLANSLHSGIIKWG